MERTGIRSPCEAWRDSGLVWSAERCGGQPRSKVPSGTAAGRLALGLCRLPDFPFFRIQTRETAVEGSKGHAKGPM